MKIIKTFSGLEFIVEEDEAENIASVFGKNSMVKLRSSEWINTKSIEAIANIDNIPTWNGHLLSKNGDSFIREGKRVYLEKENYKEIEYTPHPRYVEMKKQFKLKTLSNKSLTKVQEETAKEERKQKH